MLVQAVLFDIDDTLINLAGAQHIAFRTQLAAQCGDGVSSHPAFDVAAEAFVHDPKNFYNAYINGKMSFAEQRLARVGDAMRILELDGQPAEELWVVGYEDVVSSNWAPFEDVSPLLQALQARGIPYGAATNNVTDYQRLKLEQVGLAFDVVIGTDVTGKPKPDASMFLEGARQLGSRIENTLMIGDDVINDGLGARDAGLISLLVDRQDTLHAPDQVLTVGSLDDVMQLPRLWSS
ncbi:HAD family hydrolase [Yaniella flava]|uniref:HAD family hydrolase n=1 Tax=Yaniella flava TaxID=287930 RepID=UPI0031DF06F7